MLLLNFLSKPVNNLDEKYPNNPTPPHAIPVLRDLHWLPVAAHSRFMAMVLAFKVVSGTAPIYLTLVRPHTPARTLLSTTSAGRLVPPSLRANKGHSGK